MSRFLWVLLILSVPSLGNQLALTFEGESIQYFQADTDTTLNQFSLSGEYSHPLTNESRL